MDAIRRLWGSRRAVDLVLWLVLCVPVVVEEDGLPPDARVSLRVFQIVAIGVLAVAVLVSRRAPVLAALVPVVTSIALTGSSYSGQLMVAQVTLAFLLGRRVGGRRASAGLAAVLVGSALAFAAASSGGSTSEWFSLTSNTLGLIVLPWTVGQYVRGLAELRDGGWQLADRLEHEQDRASAQERVRERARIAGEMHDSLGHELSLIALRASALEVTPGIGEEGRRAADELRRAAETAAERLREIIGMLRDDDAEPPMAPAGQPVRTVDAVRLLVERAVRSGMAVALVDSIDEHGPAIPESTGQAVVRIVQESLTNAAKHAPGAAVEVTLGRAGDQVAVEVVDHGSPHGSPHTSDGGYGLVGLDERVRLAGGTLTVGPIENGFRVCAHLPVEQGLVALPVDPGQTSQRALASARVRLRRGMVGALWPPLAMMAVLALLYLFDAGVR